MCLTGGFFMNIKVNKRINELNDVKHLIDVQAVVMKAYQLVLLMKDIKFLILIIKIPLRILIFIPWL